MPETLPPQPTPPSKSPSDPRTEEIRKNVEAGLPRDADGNLIVDSAGFGDRKIHYIRDPNNPEKLLIAKEPIQPGSPPAEPPTTAQEELTTAVTGETPKVIVTRQDLPGFGDVPTVKETHKPKSGKKKNKYKQTNFIGEFDASEKAYREAKEASTPPSPPVVPNPEFYTSKEAPIEEMHKTYKSRRSEKPNVKQPFINEAVNDERRDYQELRKILGLPTQSERLHKLRMIVGPFELYLWKKAGIIDLLNIPMSREFVEELQKKIPILEELAKTPKAQKKLEKLQGNFRYWRYLTRLYQEKPRREYIFKP